MVFSSPIFLFLFLPFALVAYWVARRHSSDLSKLILVGSSVFFYGWWDVVYVPLILGSLFVNYYLADQIRTSQSKSLLTIGVVFNLSLLGVFKYTDLVLSTINSISSSSLNLLELTLPLAISFFTFQQIAFLVDTYKDREQKPSLIDYSLFVLFFPQLIAGPIVHHREMIHQYKKPLRFSDVPGHYFSTGMALLLVGLFKKIVVADGLSPWVSPAFDSNGNVEFYDAWIGTLAYTLQIYFDFSAYSEMAMGLAYLFGYKLPLNFDSPYKSLDISEFWRRWHITLGRFLKQYLYIPLGGSKNGLSITLFALMVTMLLGGLWHGAGWQFVMWGALHGSYLCINRLWRQTSYKLPRLFALMLTLFCVMLAWVPFRASSIDQALLIWSSMFDLTSLALPSLVTSLFSESTTVYSGLLKGWELCVILPIFIFVVTKPNIHEWLKNFKPNLSTYALVSTMGIVAIAFIGRPQTFIYFQF